MARGDSAVPLRPGKLAFLERRGARADRGGGDFSRSAVLDRSLNTLRTLLEHCDPLRTGRLTGEVGNVAVRLLKAPWELKPFEIEHLEALLEQSPGFTEALASAAIDAGDFLAAIGGLNFAEKVALVDRAVQELAPRASAAFPDESSSES